MQDMLLGKMATLPDRAVPKQLQVCPFNRMVLRADVVSTVPNLSVYTSKLVPSSGLSESNNHQGLY